MKVFVIDTEYLTWNSISLKRSPLLRKKEEPPEIIQIFVKQIFIKKKNEKLIYIKPVNYKFYPHRIAKLTSIKKRYLDNYGIKFKDAYKILIRFFPSNSLIICNGDEAQIIDINLLINKIEKKKKKLFFLNFYQIIKNRKIFKKFKKKNFIKNSEIKKTLKIKNVKSHDARNDVKILIKFLDKINFKKKEIYEYSNYFKRYYF